MRKPHVIAGDAAQCLLLHFRLQRLPAIAQCFLVASADELITAQAKENLMQLLQKSQQQVATSFRMKSLNSEQLACAVPQTTAHSTFESLLNGIPDGCWFSLVQSQFKGLALITQRHHISQAGVKRSPKPQQQVFGTAKFATATLKHQAHHEMLRRGIEQCFDDLKIPTDLL